MYKYIDCLLTLFPYEPKYFIPYNLDTRFVGHPVIESEAITANGNDFRSKYKIPNDCKIISVLPGSRKTEVSRLLPVFLKAAEELKKADDSLYFVMPTVKTVAQSVKNAVEDSQLPILVVETQSDRYGAFRASSAAIAASGTVALELAICDIPHIVAYKVSAFSAMLARKFLHIQFVNLSNILLGREIVPELLQERCVEGNIRNYIQEILRKGDLYEKQMSGFAKVREILGQGVQMPSQNVCDVIIDIVNKSKKR